MQSLSKFFSRLAHTTARTRNSLPVHTNTKLRLALVGRPNVGKSTLFNKFAGDARIARASSTSYNPSPTTFVRSVVDPAPGVTRDARIATGTISDLLLSVVDTAGLDDPSGVSSHSIIPSIEPIPLARAIARTPGPSYNQLYQRMVAATSEAVQKANAILFIIDASTGVTAGDRAVADWLRKNAPPRDVILVVNKCDMPDAHIKSMESLDLGMGDPVVISAQQGLGFADLYVELDKLYRKRRDAGILHLSENQLGDVLAVSDAPPTERELKEMIEKERHKDFEDDLIIGVGEKPGEEALRQLVVSIVGRPNVGKSTLLNCLVGHERSLVGPEAGVTRDAVLSEWNIPDKIKRVDDIPVWVVDTAGVRPRMKVEAEHLENLCVKSSLRALRHSHVVLLIIDANEPLCTQDLKLLDLVVTEGRAAVIVINKMDKLDTPNVANWRKEMRYKVDNKVEQLAGIEVVEISAKNWHQDKQQEIRLYQAIERARLRWEKRVPTSALNRFVTKFNERMTLIGGTKSAKRNRIGTTKFITQKKIRPPMFRMDGSSAVSENYLRALANAIRQEFGFQGVPIRVKRPSRRRRK